MVRSFLACLVAVLCVTLSGATGRAAEIWCERTYGQSNPFPLKNPPDIDFSAPPPATPAPPLPPGFVLDPPPPWDPLELDADLARRHWPSGARPKQGTCQVAFIRGEIAKGDYEKVLGFYRKHHPFLGEVKLISPGGDVDAALKIGRLFRKYLVAVSAPSVSNSYLPAFDHNDRALASGNACALPENHGGCACASACAFIWFGAVERQGTVGLHRPRFTDPRFSKLPPAEATKAYRQALRAIGLYLEEMEIPKTIIDTLVSTGSAEMTWIDDGFGSPADRLRMHRAPSYAEWLAASCGAWTHAEFKALTGLITKKTLEGLAPQYERFTTRDRQRLEMLLARDNQRRSCEFEVISSNRDRLPPP